MCPVSILPQCIHVPSLNTASMYPCAQSQYCLNVSMCPVSILPQCIHVPSLNTASMYPCAQSHCLNVSMCPVSILPQCIHVPSLNTASMPQCIHVPSLNTASMPQCIHPCAQSQYCLNVSMCPVSILPPCAQSQYCLIVSMCPVSILPQCIHVPSLNTASMHPCAQSQYCLNVSISMCAQSQYCLNVSMCPVSILPQCILSPLFWSGGDFGPGEILIASMYPCSAQSEILVLVRMADNYSSMILSCILTDPTHSSPTATCWNTRSPLNCPRSPLPSQSVQNWRGCTL